MYPRAFADLPIYVGFTRSNTIMKWRVSTFPRCLLCIFWAHKQWTCPDEKRRSNMMLYARVSFSCAAACISAIRNCCRLSASDRNHDRRLLQLPLVQWSKENGQTYFCRHYRFHVSLNCIYNGNISITRNFIFFRENISRIYEQARVFINIVTFL